MVYQNSIKSMFNHSHTLTENILMLNIEVYIKMSSKNELMYNLL